MMPANFMDTAAGQAATLLAGHGAALDQAAGAPVPAPAPSPAPPPPSAADEAILLAADAAYRAASMAPVERARAERGQLMADKAFRAAAMDPKSEQWQRLVALDRTIAGAEDDAAPVKKAAESQNDAAAGQHDDIPDGGFLPPESPGRYQVPDQRARGLEVDPALDMEIMKAVHGAGADQALVGAAYGIVIDAMAKAKERHDAGKGPDLMALAAQNQATTTRLQREWGTDFSARLEATHAEAQRLWEALPPKVRRESLEEFLVVTGLQGNAPFLKMLEVRARARAQKSTRG